MRGGVTLFGKRLCSRCAWVLNDLLSPGADFADGRLERWMDFVETASPTYAGSAGETTCYVCWEYLREVESHTPE